MPELYYTITLVVMGVFGQSKRHTKDNFSEKKTKEKNKIEHRRESRHDSHFLKKARIYTINGFQ